ncbi:MAG: hypothetical protein AAB599_00850 [Patescibacteria group bacterium]
MKKVYSTLFLLVTCYMLRVTFPSVAGAEVDIGTEYKPPVTDLQNVGGLVSSLASNLYILAGIVCFVLFLWGGFEWVRGAGSDDRDMVGRGKKIIFAGIYGFLIIFASYWIIQVIEKLTGLTIF